MFFFAIKIKVTQEHLREEEAVVAVPDANLSDWTSRGLVSASRERDIRKLWVII